MLHDLPAFLAIAVVVVLTPGPATALVVRNSLRGGPHAAWATTAGNSTGILAWALASVFFVALFPQFVPDGASVLAATLLMAAIVVTMDLVYFTLLSVAVSRTRSAFVKRGWGGRMERVAGTVLIALGIRLALTHR